MIKEYGYEYNTTLDLELLKTVQYQSAREELFGGMCFRSGRDALKVIAREYSGSMVLLPALCCDSMITPFEAYNCTPIFYRLNEDLTACTDDVQEKIKNVTGTVILLYSDYFGIRLFSNQFLKRVKNEHKNVVLVKDITHVFLNTNDNDTLADYVVASVRKWLNVVDGGLLWTRKKLKNSIFYEEFSFFEKRLKAQCLRTEFFETGNLEIKSIYRKLFSEVSDILDSDINPVMMSEYSYKKLQRADWAHIKKSRFENAKELMDVLSGSSKLKLIQPHVGNSDLYVPFVVNGRDELQGRLAQKGIFNTIIWPLRKEQLEICPVTEYVGMNMLAAPCDQRYTKDDMIYIGEQIVRTIDE